LASKKPHPVPAARGLGHPPSLDRPAANRPWRTGELQLQLPIPLRLSEYPALRLSRNLARPLPAQPRAETASMPGGLMEAGHGGGSAVRLAASCSVRRQPGRVGDMADLEVVAPHAGRCAPQSA